MKTHANSTLADTGCPASAIPASPAGRNQLYIHNISPVRVKYGWEIETRFSGSGEGVPLEPGDWRILGGEGVDLRGALYLITDDLGSTMTGDTSNGSAIVTGLANTVAAALLAGMRVTGTGIPDDTYIVSVDSATQIALSRNATATGNDVALTLSAPVVYTQR